MTELFLLTVIAGGLLYWQSSVRCKELAVKGAKRECDIADVQLLDQTVAQIRLSFSRDHQDRWRVWREYRFDYSHDGVDRFEGRIVMLGQRVVRSSLETFKPVIH